MTYEQNISLENGAQAGAWSDEEMRMFSAYIEELEAHELAELAELAGGDR